MQSLNWKNHKVTMTEDETVIYEYLTITGHAMQ